MRKATMLVIGLFVLGIILLGASVAQGGGTVYLALIFPIYAGSDIWGFLGILCIIGALFVGFFSLIPGSLSARSTGQPRQAAPTSGGEKKFGGVVMLGPIPIIFGSDLKMSIVAMILAIILIVVLVVSLLFFLPGLVG